MLKSIDAGEGLNQISSDQMRKHLALIAVPTSGSGYFTFRGKEEPIFLRP
jgi:hypothetical protein